MKIIKIISGTYGYKVGGTVVPKTSKNGPFELDDEAAARLVRLNVAEYTDEVPDEVPEPQGGPLAYDDSTTLARLKEIASAYNGDASKCRKKADAIAIIEAAKAGGNGADDKEDDELEDEDDGEAPPIIPPAPPV